MSMNFIYDYMESLAACMAVSAEAGVDAGSLAMLSLLMADLVRLSHGKGAAA